MSCLTFLQRLKCCRQNYRALRTQGDPVLSRIQQGLSTRKSCNLCVAINFPTPDLEGREISLGDDVMGLREELSKRQEQFAKYFVTAMACGAVSVALLIGACVFHLIEEKAVNTVYLIAASIIGGAGLVFAILSAIYYRPLSATFSQMQEKYNSHTGAGTTDIELG